MEFPSLKLSVGIFSQRAQLCLPATSHPKLQASSFFVGATNLIDIIDFFPHAGEPQLALAALALQQDPLFTASVRVSTACMSYKKGIKNAQFSMQRFNNAIAKKWQAKEMLLYDFVGDEGCLAPVMEPTAAVDENNLKELPGCYEAWKKIANLELQVCKLTRKKFKIFPEILAEFQSAPA